MNPTRGVTEVTARIDGCQHVWRPAGLDRVRCGGPCGVVLAGSLAEQPPAQGMDWSRAVLVRSSWTGRTDAAGHEPEGQEAER